jgi:transaldolase
MNPLDRLTALGTSVWVDALVEPMELARLMERDAVTGLTSNPTILDRAMTGGADYATRAALFANVMSPRSLFDALVITDMQALADVLAPVYRRTHGLDGYVSLEVPPDLAYDADATVASARDLWTRLDRPNAMIKIPATAAGIDAIARVIADGINVNATLLFSLQAYAALIEAYLAGLETRLRHGQSIDQIASVASFFVSRIDTAVDPLLRSVGRFDLQGLAGVASAHRAYDLARERFASDRFASLRAHGARPQRPLWASTGTKGCALQRRQVRRGVGGARRCQHDAARDAVSVPRSRQSVGSPFARRRDRICRARSNRVRGSRPLLGHAPAPARRRRRFRRLDERAARKPRPPDTNRCMNHPPTHPERRTS